MRRWRQGLIAAAACLIAPAGAQAATYYAAPGNDTTVADCATAAVGCSLGTAAGLAGSTDQIVVLPGTYTGQPGTIDVQASSITGAPGAAMPVIEGTTFDILKPGAIIDRVEVIDIDQTQGDAPIGISLGTDATLSDSAVYVSAPGAGQGAAAEIAGDGATLIGDTLIGPFGVVVEPASSSVTATIENSIVHGSEDDLATVQSPGASATIDVSYSDYQSTNTNFGGTIVPGPGNLSTPADLVDPAAGDFAEQPDSVTINRGNPAAVPAADSEDLAGNPRIQGSAPDIGAVEFPLPVVGSAPATVNGTSVVVSGTVDPMGEPVGSCAIEYGPTTSYGFTAACPSGLGTGTAPVSVTAALPGLAAGSTYHFAVLAANAAGTAIGADGTFTVPAAPSVTITGPAGASIFSLGQVVPAAYTCAEGSGGPGLDSCVGPVANGVNVDTATIGTHTFTVVATSQDGETTTRTVIYTVVAPLGSPTTTSPTTTTPTTTTPTTTTPTTTPTKPGAATAKFAIDKVAVNAKGSVSVALTLPVSGGLTLVVTAKGHAGTYAKLVLSGARAGRRTYTVTPGSGGRALLRALHRKLVLALAVSYAPYGSAQRQTKSGLHPA